MNYKLRKIQDADVKNKTVLLRADLDVPILNGEISDSSRLEASIPIIEYLLKQNTKVIIAGHLGRPNPVISNQSSVISQNEFSLKPVAKWIAERFKINDLRLKNFGEFEGWEINENISMLQNLRFYKGEEENDKEFSQKLVSLADIYVNDAFASSHRSHASIVGVTKYLPSFAGFKLQKEVEVLSQILENPKRPLCVIIGGAKIETKLPLVEKMHSFADYVLVGGEIAENDKVLLKVQHEKLEGEKSALLIADLTQNSKDITTKSVENFLQIAQNCQTIVWNGPMGLIEEEENAKGTEILARGLSGLSSHTIVGGGDTLAFLKKENLLDKFSFVSTGGGAMLEFLAGEKLPGLLALIQ